MELLSDQKRTDLMHEELTTGRMEAAVICFGSHFWFAVKGVKSVR